MQIEASEGQFIILEDITISRLLTNMNKLLLFFIIFINSLCAQEIHYIGNLSLNEDEIYLSRAEYFSFGAPKHEIILIDYNRKEDTNCYRITSSINALEIVARRPCAYIAEQNLMTYIFCEDSIKISDTLVLGKAFEQSLEAMQLPIRAINWNENGYYDCSAFYELVMEFDPFIIEYSFLNGKLVEEKFKDEMFYKRFRPKCILSGKYEDKCNCE
ncbi:MAG: hypothetical protein PHG67_13900 [Bacteroidales bacterium]|nr:hypothetical protein [Bacteroidales bacterium]